MNVSKAIRTIRRQRDMSQEDLAEKAFLSQNVISRLESGAIKITVAHFNQIAKALDISVADLVVRSLEEEDFKSPRSSVPKVKIILEDL